MVYRMVMLHDMPQVKHYILIFKAQMPSLVAATAASLIQANLRIAATQSDLEVPIVVLYALSRTAYTGSDHTICQELRPRY